MSDPTTTSTPGASSSNTASPFPSTSAASPSAETHLSYPSSKPRAPTPPPEPSRPREVLKNRLYVGNLHPSVDEYTLLQVFSKYGKISKLDFLFNKAGPARGKPRGYAFVEYSDKDDALRALVSAHDKLLRGRKIVVTYANQAPPSDTGPARPFHRRTEASRPTTLSMLKASGQSGRTEDKIAALEAKLRQMEDSDKPAPSTLPSHPSLPLKPPPATLPSVNVATTSTSASNVSKPKQSAMSTNATNTGTAATRMRAPDARSLGKKPTLDELLRQNRLAHTSTGGLLKR